MSGIIDIVCKLYTPQTVAEGRLSRFKVPKKLTTLSELPRNAAGKILKSELRKLADSS